MTPNEELWTTQLEINRLNGETNRKTLEAVKWQGRAIVALGIAVIATQVSLVVLLLKEILR